MSTADAGDDGPARSNAAAVFGDWTVTPMVVGAGVRVVSVTPDSKPSLREAVAAARAGDEVRLAAGTYLLTGGNLTLAASGTAAHWIALRGPAEGAPAIVDLGGGGELGIAGSYVLLEGVEIVHGGGNNLHVAPRTATVHDVIVRRCHIHGLASGPGAAIKVNRNNDARAGVERIYLEDNDCSEAIGNALIDGVGVHQAVARRNHLHDNAKGSHGIFFKGGSSEILIEGNLIQRIRGNAALQLGGNTGPAFFDPAHPDQEGVDQLARNNVIADCDDSIFEVRGVRRGRIDHNTVLTHTGFAILRFAKGNVSGGGSCGNDEIEFGNNLVLSEGAAPQFARNDAGSVHLSFGPTLWGGTFANSSSPGEGIPRFPRPGDVVVDAARLRSILVDPSVEGATSVADAMSRCRPVRGSPARAAGAPDAAWVPTDASSTPRSKAKPTLGALEGD